MAEEVIPLEQIGKMGTVKVYNQAYVDKLQSQLTEKDKQIEELKSRNAELRGNYVHSAREAETYKQFCEQKDKQIEEAKEIIRTFYGLCEVFYSSNGSVDKFMYKVKAFLEEIDHETKA